ncbi:MAG: DUF1592 domain-containing protein [Polyangiaceae bacterium]|nr:DUF1592 domain-containing protein [Polyangiaceae bacterium]
MKCLAGEALAALSIFGLLGCTGSVPGSSPGPGSLASASGGDGSVVGASGGAIGSGGAGMGPGGIVVGTGGAAVVGECTNPGVLSPGDAPLRRLTHTEYDNTVEALLGVNTKPARAFPLEERAYNFDNNATVRSVSQILAEQYEAAATSLGVTAISNLNGLLGCDPVASGEDACAGQFIDAFGLKSYRRPLSAAEKTRLLAFYQTSKGTEGFANAIQMVASAILQTPQFLYRMETAETAGPAVGAAPGIIEAGPYERASRLSYLLTQSMPDEELLGAAARGELGTKEQVVAQAQRLLTTPKARGSVVSFHAQWLDFLSMGQLTKDATQFPTFTPEIAGFMRQEAEAFVEHTIFDGPGDMGALLQSPQSYMNDALAMFYGVTPPGSPVAPAAVALPATQRSGLLTLAGLLGGHSTPVQGNPVTRGFFIRDSLLCQTPPAPPKNANIMVPAFNPALTTRERFAAHSTDPACRSCHQLMDPIGFGFENYDAVGMWRDQEAGKPVDGHGELTGTDVDGTFNGAVELGQKLGASKMVRDCATTQWFHFAYGRVETGEDACTLQQLKTAFNASKGNVKELLLGITQTDAFLFRKAP